MFGIYLIYELLKELIQISNGELALSSKLTWSVGGSGKLQLVLASTVILVPSSAGLMTMFYCLTTLGMVQLALK
jgi:hypothetical protein